METALALRAPEVEAKRLDAEAHALEIARAHRTFIEAFLVFGELLYTFEAGEKYRYLSDGAGPYASFDKWLRGQSAFRYSSARFALAVYKRYVVELGFSLDELVRVDYSKFQELAAPVGELLARQALPASAPEHVPPERARSLIGAWVHMAEDCSGRELTEAYLEQGATLDRPLEDAEATPLWRAWRGTVDAATASPELLEVLGALARALGWQDPALVVLDVKAKFTNGGNHDKQTE